MPNFTNRFLLSISWSIFLLTFSTLASSATPVITQGASIKLVTNQNTFKRITLNATDAGGSTLRWSVSKQGTKGKAAAGGTGSSKSVRYTPNNNVTGTDSFIVRVKNASNKSDTITVNVIIHAVPVITEGESIALVTNENTYKIITLNATDAGGSTLTWSVSKQGTKGKAAAGGTGLSRNVRYTPNENETGTDSFIVKVKNALNKSDTILVKVTIDEVNGTPNPQENISQYIYDDYGRLEALKINGVSAVDYELDNNNNRKSVSYKEVQQ